MTIRMAPRVELTSDHRSILHSGEGGVDRSGVSIQGVPGGCLKDRPTGTKVLPRDLA